MNNYSYEDKLEFQGRDKRIMFQSIFSSLCTKYQGAEITTDELTKIAFIIVEELIEKYPMVEIKDEPFISHKAPTNDMSPSHCPECGADVKHKSGVSKAGKPYDFIGCGAYPACSWTYKPDRN